MAQKAKSIIIIVVISLARVDNKRPNMGEFGTIRTYCYIIKQLSKKLKHLTFYLYIYFAIGVDK